MEEVEGKDGAGKSETDNHGGIICVYLTQVKTIQEIMLICYGDQFLYFKSTQISHDWSIRFTDMRVGLWDAFSREKYALNYFSLLGKENSSIIM